MARAVVVRVGLAACWPGVCRPGWLRCGHARKVLDRLLAGKTPANVGRGRGQELRGRVGEHLGSKGKLQDVLSHGFGRTNHHNWPSAGALSLRKQSDSHIASLQ